MPLQLKTAALFYVAEGVENQNLLYFTNNNPA